MKSQKLPDNLLPSPLGSGEPHDQGIQAYKPQIN